MEEKHKTKILIVDDHPLVRIGLRQLINEETNLFVSAEAEDTTQALEEISRQQPDIALIEISLKGISGIVLIKKIKHQYPDIKCMVFSMHDESLYAKQALRAGAKGYVMKTKATDIIITAIHKILEGGIYMSEAVKNILVKDMVELLQNGNN